MALVKFIQSTESKISSASISNGTFYVSTDTKKLYIDIDGQRIQVGKDSDTKYTLSKSGNTIELSGSDGSFYQVADANTTYNNATSTVSGLMSSADKAKLDSLVAVSASEKSKWNAAYNHSISAHAPSNAEVNQNAFSNISVNGSVISADSKTDTLTLSGSNITLTPNTALDNITFSLNKMNVVNALGYTPPTTNTTYSVVSTTANGLAPKRDGNTNSFLRGDGLWATPTLSNLGVSATTTQLDYLIGATSNIQTQLNNKAPNDIIAIQKTQPTSSDCKIWIKI